MRLQDKVVLITAATRGIGLACVKACVKEGARVYLAARDPARAQTIADALHAQGGFVRCVFCDATKPESLVTMVRDAVSEAGRLDVLINNFGASDPQRDLDFSRTEPEVFLETVMLNLRSVFTASREAVRHMPNGGSIINISSVGGSVPDLSQVGYGTGKAAINYLTKLIAVHEAKRRIRCNAVLPGMTETQAVTQRLSEEFRALFLRHVPLGRMGLAEEVASAAVYLASDEAAYVTGQLLSVSGGFGLASPLYAELSGSDTRR